MQIHGPIFYSSLFYMNSSQTFVLQCKVLGIISYTYDTYNTLYTKENAFKCNSKLKNQRV